MSSVNSVTSVSSALSQASGKFSDTNSPPTATQEEKVTVVMRIKMGKRIRPSSAKASDAEREVGWNTSPLLQKQSDSCL